MARSGPSVALRPRHWRYARCAPEAAVRAATIGFRSGPSVALRSRRWRYYARRDPEAAVPAATAG